MEMSRDNRITPRREQFPGRVRWLRALPAVLILAVVLLLGILPVRPGLVMAEPAGDSHQEYIASLDQVGAGQLLRRTADGYQRLPIVETNVDLSITGPLISGVINQRFRNSTDEVIEAIYVFPLPEQAAVHFMEMYVGERRIVSVIKEKQQARQTYERARAAGQKTALVESERPNLFTTSVANINPGEAIEVELRYHDFADFEAGTFSLAFPLTFTPRYYPPSALLGVDLHTTLLNHIEAARVRPPFVAPDNAAFPVASISIRLQPGFPLARLASDSHDVRFDENDNQWTITTASATVPADRDFLLLWQPEPGNEPRSAMFWEDRPDGRYTLLMTVPPRPAITGESTIITASTEQGLKTETMFVIDVSGSMEGPSIVQAREALLEALDRLEPGDTFNILEFNNQSRLFQASFQPVRSSALRDARRWVRAMRARGGTEMYPALLRAVSRFAGSEGPHNRRIILITDAAIGNEAQLLEEVATGLGPIRLHIVGIGNAPNRFLVRKLAELGGGKSAFVAAEANAANGIDAFLASIGRPVMTDLALTWTGDQPAAAYPSQLPDLFAGSPLIIAARFDSLVIPEAILTGRLGELEYHTDLSPSDGLSNHSGIATLWARRKVSDLTDQQYGGADPDSIREQIIDTGLQFNLVTQHTSLVAVEQKITAMDSARTRRMPNGLPAGSRLLANATGSLPMTGTSAPLRRVVGVTLLLIGSTVLITRRRLQTRCSVRPAVAFNRLSRQHRGDRS